MGDFWENSQALNLFSVSIDSISNGMVHLTQYVTPCVLCATSSRIIRWLRSLLSRLPTNLGRKEPLCVTCRRELSRCSSLILRGLRICFSNLGRATQVC